MRNFYRDIQKKDGFSSSCKKCHREQQIISYEKRRQKIIDYAKQYYSKNKKKQILRQREIRKEIISEIHNLLGNKYERCGIKDKRILQIDHLNGKGYRHRKISGCGMSYYRDILKSIKSNKKEYRLLCANCNLIEGIRKGYRQSIWS